MKVSEQFQRKSVSDIVKMHQKTVQFSHVP